MSNSLLLSFVALAALVPAALAPVMRSGSVATARDGVYWALIGVAFAGPALWISVQLGTAWRTGLAPALWLSIAVSLVLFAVVAAASRVAWRLTPLLLGYLFLLGVLATILQHAPERPLSVNPPEAWLQAHILVSISAYGLLTLAAVAGCGVFLQERALKLKRPNAFTHQFTRSAPISRRGLVGTACANMPSTSRRPRIFTGRNIPG